MSNQTDAVFRVFETPYAPFGVAFETVSAQIVASGFTSNIAELNEILPGMRLVTTANRMVELAARDVQKYLESYFSGKPSSAAKIIDPNPRGTQFQKDVWKEISKIPFSSTTSYMDIAAGIGRPNSWRATGTACGANTLALFIPCHRVVPASGSTGNYRWGTEIKGKLLSRERSMAQ